MAKACMKIRCISTTLVHNGVCHGQTQHKSQNESAAWFSETDRGKLLKRYPIPHAKFCSQSGDHLCSCGNVSVESQLQPWIVLARPVDNRPAGIEPGRPARIPKRNQRCVLRGTDEVCAHTKSLFP